MATVFDHIGNVINAANVETCTNDKSLTMANSWSIFNVYVIIKKIPGIWATTHQTPGILAKGSDNFQPLVVGNVI